MSIDPQEWFRQQRRESIKNRRREYHRAVKGIEGVDSDHEEWQSYLGNLIGTVDAWFWSISGPLERAVEDGAQPYHHYWYEEQFGDVKGIKRFMDRLHEVSRDELPPPKVLMDVGEALGEISVIGLDLPEQPPVVDPWSPEEREPLDTAELAEELGLPEDTITPDEDE